MIQIKKTALLINCTAINKVSKFLFIILLCTIFLSTPCQADSLFGQKIAEHAADQVGKTFFYTSDYRKIPYPGGDIHITKGVCSDVIIRSYRQEGIDLQKLVHEDMKKNFNLYPKIWGLTKPDTNIDHRRVPNLQVFFKRHGQVLPNDRDFQTGDIITWNLNPKGSTPHIGIVANKKASDGTPYITHNIGWGTRTDNMLFDYPITGHYRYHP